MDATTWAGLVYGVKPYHVLGVALVYRFGGLTEAEIKIASIRGCNSSVVRVACGFTPGFENKNSLRFRRPL